MKMEKFVKLMTGHFDNREQFTEMKSAGKLFPYARHVNTVCNDKINNIPENFTGIFMVEESYYETDGKCHASPHLFLIIVTGELCFLPTKFRQEKTKIRFLMLP